MFISKDSWLRVGVERTAAVAAWGLAAPCTFKAEPSSWKTQPSTATGLLAVMEVAKALVTPGVVVVAAGSGAVEI
jgi:hypothetical protein